MSVTEGFTDWELFLEPAASSPLERVDLEPGPPSPLKRSTTVTCVIVVVKTPLIRVRALSDPFLQTSVYGPKRNNSGSEGREATTVKHLKVLQFVTDDHAVGMGHSWSLMSRTPPKAPGGRIGFWGSDCTTYVTHPGLCHYCLIQSV